VCENPRMARRQLALFLILGSLALGGALLPHVAAFAEPSHRELAELAERDEPHADSSGTQPTAVLAILEAAVIAGSAWLAQRRLGNRRLRALVTVAVPAISFLVAEAIERVGASEQTAAHIEPGVLGLAFTILPLTGLAFLLARLLFRAVRLVVHAIRRRQRPVRVRSRAPVGPHAHVGPVVPRVSILASGYAGRAPPPQVIPVPV
jgi:hypothetical protein